MPLNVLNKPSKIVARAESKLIFEPTIDVPEEIKSEAERQATQLRSPTNCETVNVQEY